MYKGVLKKAIVTVNFFHTTGGDTVAQFETPVMYKGDGEVLSYESVPGTDHLAMNRLLDKINEDMQQIAKVGWKDFW